MHRYSSKLTDCPVRSLAPAPSAPDHGARIVVCIKLLNVRLGLLFNFHEVELGDGISRLILPGANEP